MISFELSQPARLALHSRVRPASPCLSRSVFALTLLGLLLSLGASAQQPPADSPGGEPHRVHLLVGARIIPEPGKVIERGTVLIRDGIIATDRNQSRSASVARASD